MCGVIGYVGAGATPSFFLNALRRLEYRGYDSSGIAMLSHGEISIQRAEGKLSQLEPKLALLPERRKWELVTRVGPLMVSPPRTMLIRTVQVHLFCCTMGSLKTTVF